jgi:SAM-dependent methyltransferase
MSAETRTEHDPWAAYRRRYQAGVWRDRIIHDMILADARTFGDRPTIVEIGCGGGLDSDVPLQRSIARAAGRFIGIEPDTAIELGDYFTETHRCLFERAPLGPGSAHVAYAVMVLEHLPDPQPFWDKVREVLVPGGVFWALTVDARHPFCTVSSWMGRLHLKDAYLRLRYGRRGVDRYENYPTYYRSNTPEQVARLAAGFRSCEAINFARVGQYSGYLPAPLRPLAHWHDRRDLRRGRPGTLLAVRAVKGEDGNHAGP